MSPSLTFRTLAIGVVAAGLALGIAFGVGVAYGRGNPKTVQSGLTTQQIQQMYGPATSGAAGAGGQGAGGAGAAGAASVLGARSTSGRVTAVSGQTVTIETRQGSQKVLLSSSTTVNKLATGASADLQEGSTIVASGTRKDDGSFEATSVSQVPAELVTLVAGGGTSAPTVTPAAR